MSERPSRREFLQTGALMAAGTVAASVAPLVADGHRRDAGATAAEPFERTGRPRLKLSCAAYSYRQFLTGDQPTMTLNDFVDRCAAMDLDGCEPTSYYFPNEVTDDYLIALKRQAFLLGLDISGTAVGNNFCLPPGAERDAQIAHVERWVDHAAVFGAPVIRIFSGGVPDGSTEDEARGWCVECIEQACAYAGRHGIFLALENHGGISTTAEQLLAIAEQVQSPWFGINLDTGNFRGGDPYEQMAAVAPYAVNVQVKTELSVDGRRQETDLARIIEIVREAGYRGYLVLEYEASEDPMTAIPRYVETLRSLIA